MNRPVRESAGNNLLTMPTSLTIEKLVTTDLHSPLLQHKTCIGIDFGTSTTVVSYAYYDCTINRVVCKTMSLEQRMQDGTKCTAEILPTVIALTGNQLLVGEGASELKYELEKNKNIWYSFKMELGENLGSKYYNSELGKNRNIQILNAKDATTLFFKYLKKQIEQQVQINQLSNEIEYAVSIPASFEANQRQDLVDALISNQMDICKQSLIDEPNAAFLSYIYEAESSENPIIIPDDINPKVLVFDFGAGTCDISLLEIGMNQNGMYTKNLSISKFEQLGGDDIDRYIVYEYLLPLFFEKNKVCEDDFITSEKRKIADRLLKIAENLKIKICKAVSLMREDYDLSSISSEEYRVTVREDININSTKGVLRMSEFELTSIQFAQIMSVFVRKKTNMQKKQTHAGNQYNSIYASMESSLKKGKVRPTDIDYVLFIGGSSKNPYVQEAIRKWLPDAKLLLPQDTQIHVSKGAAIHSLIYNCYGQNIVQPITSEPICVITRNGELQTLIPAGTTIPTDVLKIDNLVVAKEGQKKVELPICISNRNKLLSNLEITSSNPNGFSSETPIILELELTADKLLLAAARINDDVCFIKPVNPFANKELTTQERIALKAEREAYEDAANNAGEASKKILLKLGKAYEDADLKFRAAETYEQCNNLYPNSVSANTIENCYSAAGKIHKAIYYAEKEYAQKRNAVTAFNLGVLYKRKGEETYLNYIHESLKYEPNKPHALFELGRYEKLHGIETWREKIEKAFNVWKSKYDANELNPVDFTWLPSAAEELGKYEFAKEVRAKAQKAKEESTYDINNVAKVKGNNYELDTI